jgi:tetratricopeptide (TPR) repeat protein
MTLFRFAKTFLFIPAVLAISLFIFSPADESSAGDPILLNDYALQLMEKGDPDKALEQLQKAVSLFPYEPTLRKNLAELYTVQGQRRMATGRYEEAATSFDNARELFPDEQRYVVLRGIALYSAKQYDAAIVELERSRGLGPDSPDILAFLGRAQYDSGNLPSAIESWEKGLELDPARKDIGMLLSKAKREQAVEGKMDRGYSSRFVVSYDVGDRANLSDQVLDVLETAYNRVGSDFSHFPTARIPVLLYTRTDYKSVTKSPDWSGGLYDGKIRLPIGGVSELNEVLRSILFHEYTHVIIHELTSGNCPMWLNEGLAELEGRREYSHQLTDLEKAVRQNQLLPLASLERSFSSLSTHDASVAYQQSYSFVKYLVSTYGWYKVKEILLSLGTGKTITDSVNAALTDLGIDYPALYNEWLASVQKEYRP